MKEPDRLDALLREWKSPEPVEELDRRVTLAYRSAVHWRSFGPRAWRGFWKLRISVPAPVLLVAVLAAIALFFWLRSAAAPSGSPGTSGAVTRLNASGFQPLPNGQARVVPVSEVQK